jgi:uncharacterized spore protein YtfJ
MHEATGTLTSKNNDRPHGVDVEMAPSIIERVAEGVVGRALNQAQASTVYGEAQKQGDRTVIPVARVSARYGFGGGAGHGTSAETDSETGSGGGGGGGGAIDARPVGYIEITPQETRFVPIVDNSAVAIRAVTMFGIAAMLLMIGLTRRK